MSADSPPLHAAGARLYWPPMHLRGAPRSLTDTLHIVWSAATLLLVLVTITFGAAAFGR